MNITKNADMESIGKHEKLHYNLEICLVYRFKYKRNDGFNVNLINLNFLFVCSRILSMSWKPLKVLLYNECMYIW